MSVQRIQIPEGDIIVDLIDASGNTIHSIHSSGEKIFDLINKGIESLYEKNGCGSIRAASPAPSSGQ